MVAPPQMAHYMKISARIYEVYLKYIAPEDIHVYSIDEVFIDATSYLKTYRQFVQSYDCVILTLLSNANKPLEKPNFL